MTDDSRIHLRNTYRVHRPSTLQEHPQEDPATLQVGKARVAEGERLTQGPTEPSGRAGTVHRIWYVCKTWALAATG